MIGEVEVVALVILDDVGHSWHSGQVEWASVNCAAFIIDQTSVDEGQIVVGNVFDHFLSSRIADVTETKQFGAAEIVLEGNNMLVELVLVSCEVGLIPIFRISPLFAAPGNESDCSLGSQSVSQEQSHGFETSDETSSVVIGSGLRSSIPGIDMSAHQQDLIRFFCSLDFEHQVIGVSIVNNFVLQHKFKSDFLASILHPLEHLSVFNRNGSNWYLTVVLNACMNRIDGS